MISFYKPNTTSTGTAFAFKLGQTHKTKEPIVYLNGIAQASWNAKTRTGSFSENAKNPDKTVGVKFNEFEMGGFINAIENYTEFSAFHTFDDNKTTISFKPYSKKDGTKAFSFTITKNSALKFGIGMEISEAYALREFFKYALARIYDARTVAAEKAFAEYQNNQ